MGAFRASKNSQHRWVEFHMADCAWTPQLPGCYTDPAGESLPFLHTEASALLSHLLHIYLCVHIFRVPTTKHKYGREEPVSPLSICMFVGTSPRRLYVCTCAYKHMKRLQSDTDPIWSIWNFDNTGGASVSARNLFLDPQQISKTPDTKIQFLAR